jgi:hypothetical protein
MVFDEEEGKESEEEEEKEELEVKEEEESRGQEAESEETAEEFATMTVADIEVLMKNTEIWDKLLSGRISIEEAKKMFDEVQSSYSTDKRKKRTTKKAKKAKSKKTNEEVGEEEE